MPRMTYDRDDAAFPAEAYALAGWGEGIAWRVLGWQTEADEDTEWDGILKLTGRAVCRMVGDDRDFAAEPEDLTPLGELDYCAECGQVGCTHDGRDRTEVAP